MNVDRILLTDDERAALGDLWGNLQQAQHAWEGALQMAARLASRRNGMDATKFRLVLSPDRDAFLVSMPNGGATPR